jgi:hypothetical protein
MLIVALHVRDYTRVSPSDELQHYDYVVRVVRDHEVVRRGDQFTQEAMHTEACDGLDAEYRPPPCRPLPYQPPQFQEGGYNTAFIHGPVYYVVTGALAAVMSGIASTHNLFTTARLAGAFWLGLAVWLLWLAMGELKVDPMRRAVVLVLVITAPAVMESNAVITTDATALLAGAAVLYAVLRFERGASAWPAALAAMLAVALKSTNVMAVGVAVLYLLVRWMQDRGPLQRRAIAVGAMSAGAVVVAGAWAVYSSAAARVPLLTIPMERRFHVASLGVREFGRNLAAGFTPMTPWHIPVEIRAFWMPSVAQLVDHLFLAGLVAAAVFGLARSRERALAVAVLISLLLAGPVFVLVNYVGTSTYVDIPHRYALSVLPAIAAVVPVLLADRRTMQLVGGGAAVVGVLTLTALVW